MLQGQHPRSRRRAPRRGARAGAGANDIVLRTGACGICGTDITYVEAGACWPAPLPP